MPAICKQKQFIEGEYDWRSPSSGSTTARSSCSRSDCSERAKPRDEDLDQEQCDSASGVPYSTRDLLLVETFYELAKLEDPSVETLKLLLQTVMMLRSCGYDMHDVCICLAHASVYFTDIQKKCDKMGPGEAGYIIVLLIYLAHSYVLDENCQLRTWHRYLFKNYCSLKILDKALVSMFKLRGYLLRIDESVLQERLAVLLPCVR